mgnify:CR=1 FL=1
MPTEIETQELKTAEHAAFEKWAFDRWKNSLPPEHAWTGWKARADAAALDSPIGEQGVKPLDLANLLHHAFAAGGRAQPWTDYDPATCHAYARILSALSPERKEPGWREVLAERRRQVEAEGWTPGHDDGHVSGEMAAAAACYAFTAVKSPHYINQIWPWSYDWWKPRDKRRNLVKAGALILAEIERLDRASSATPGQPT